MEIKSAFKLSLISLCVIAPGISLARTCSPCTFNGWSIGVGVGATTFMTDIKTDATLNSPNFFGDIIPLLAPLPVLDQNIMTGSFNDDLYKYGIMGSLFVGFGQVYSNNAYLGAELGLNFFGASKTSQNGTTNNNLYVTNTDSAIPNFDDLAVSQQIAAKTKVTRNSIEPFLDVKLGYLITPTTLGYLRGGLSYNTFQIKTNAQYSSIGDATASFVGGPFVNTGSVSAQNSHSQSGINWRAGAGMEVLITPNIGLGADYVYTFYRNVSTSLSGSGTDISCDLTEGCVTGPAALNASSKATIADQEVMAQLIYHFA